MSRVDGPKISMEPTRRSNCGDSLALFCIIYYILYTIYYILYIIYYILYEEAKNPLKDLQPRALIFEGFF